MTQEFPAHGTSGDSRASSSFEAGEALAAEIHSERTPQPIPSHQSRPGREDDVMLATGRPVDAKARLAGGLRSGWRGRAREASDRQEQIRSQHGRRPWIPNQHGAWSMLIVPPIVGWLVGGVSWKNLLFLPAWWSAYFTYWAWSQWLRTRSPAKRRLILLPLGVYTAATTLLVLITLAVAPYLAQFAIPLLPLFAVALWEMWRGRERSLLSGLATTAAASLMAAATYCLGVGGAGGFLGVGTGADALPGSSPNGEITGWNWMWVVTALTVAYFCSLVPYIKSMIRERRNTKFWVGTVVCHVILAALVVAAAAEGMVAWAHAVLWVMLALRSWLVPWLNRRQLRRTGRGIKPRTMGLVEMIFTLAFLVTVNLA